jgi:hypothetical protein
MSSMSAAGTREREGEHQRPRTCGILRRSHKLTNMQSGKSSRLHTTDESGELGSPGNAGGKGAAAR